MPKRPTDPHALEVVHAIFDGPMLRLPATWTMRRYMVPHFAAKLTNLILIGIVRYKASSIDVERAYKRDRQERLEVHLSDAKDRCAISCVDQIAHLKRV